jgi:hypothetical protein
VVRKLGVLLISHATAARGNLLTTHRYNVWDMIAPLGLGTTECLLFAVLRPLRLNPYTYGYWLLFLSIHSAFAVILIKTRLAHTDDVNY